MSVAHMAHSRISDWFLYFTFYLLQCLFYNRIPYLKLLRDAMLLCLLNLEHHLLLLASMQCIKVVNLQGMFSHNEVEQLALPRC
jgi:hypothetical protein